MAPSSRLQFPFPLFPTSLARFPSTTTFCPSAPLVCSVTARLVADTPSVSWPAASSAQPFLEIPTFLSETSLFQGEVLPEFLVPKIDFQGEVLSNFPLLNVDFPGEVLPKFSALTTHFSKGRFCQNFLSWPSVFKGRFWQNFPLSPSVLQGEVLPKKILSKNLPFLDAHIHIYTHKQILILTEEEYFDPCSWW